jgi:methylated-DNA-[protein]-cysteine S-methyltransferase
MAKIIGNELGILSISISEESDAPSIEIDPCLIACVKQLDEYFKGIRTEFSLPLIPQGSEFQKRVWKELTKVSFGETRTYMEQAKKLGDKKAIRAVAAANGKNPIWIIIPCHRILGSDGSLTGYAGEIWRKKWLLGHEGLPKQARLF